MTTTKRPRPYALRVISYVIKLPSHFTDFEQKTSKNQSDINTLKKETIDKIEDVTSSIDRFQKLVNRVDDRISNMNHLLSISKQKDSSIPSTIKGRVVNKTVSDNHDYDMFYKKFEDKFRGSETLIKERLSEHLHLFKNLSAHLGNGPIVDIGCGRGEFLSVMSDNNFKAIGVDMNEDMVNSAKNLGFNAIQNDALSYLSAQKQNSLSAITGFHIVEHIPFEPLMNIFAECYRTIKKGGFVLFETPNPRSLTVGANTFYLDPSHLHPVPPELLAFMLEYTGFSPEIIPLHRQQPELTTDNSALHDVHEAIFSYADYAVVGRKD